MSRVSENQSQDLLHAPQQAGVRTLEDQTRVFLFSFFLPPIQDSNLRISIFKNVQSNRRLRRRPPPPPPTTVSQQRELLECKDCGRMYREGYRQRHILSTAHKQAIHQLDNTPINGRVIRSIGERTVYDIVFTPTKGKFSRPAEPLTDKSLHDDLDTIEDFFAYFHQGIITRMEEASVKYV